MRKSYRMMIALLIGGAPCLFAETNALIEVKIFKDWMIKEERLSGHISLAIKNTGAGPIRLANDPVDFAIGQLAVRTLPRKPDTPDEKAWQEEEYQVIVQSGFGKIGGGNVFFELFPGETHVYEGRKFGTRNEFPFSDEIRFTVSVYLGNGFYLDSETVTIKGVVPDSEEYLVTITDGVNPYQYELRTITYKNERWLYSKLTRYFPICPVSLTNKIHVEPHDGKRLHKIWDGDKAMIYELGQNIILEGPDENDVFGKWTRERKRKADADNAEVRRKRGEDK